MGFFTSLIAKEYGKGLAGDYKDCKIGEKWEGKDLRIIKRKGKDIEITKKNVRSFNVEKEYTGSDLLYDEKQIKEHPELADRYPELAFVDLYIYFTDGTSGLFRLSVQAWEVFQRLMQ